MRLRFRSWIILTLEIIIPTIIIIAIGGVKNAVGNSTYDQVIHHLSQASHTLNQHPSNKSYVLNSLTVICIEFTHVTHPDIMPLSSGDSIGLSPRKCVGGSVSDGRTSVR